MIWISDVTLTPETTSISWSCCQRSHQKSKEVKPSSKDKLDKVIVICCCCCHLLLLNISNTRLTSAVLWAESPILDQKVGGWSVVTQVLCFLFTPHCLSPSRCIDLLLVNIILGVNLWWTRIPFMMPDTRSRLERRGSTPRQSLLLFVLLFTVVAGRCIYLFCLFVSVYWFHSLFCIILSSC